MRILQGTITSNRMSRTVVVRVDRLRQHRKYRKFYRVSRRYKAQVEGAAAYTIGDVVRIQETRPVSKEKRWRVIEVIEKAPRMEVPAEDAGAALPEASGDERRGESTAAR